MEEPELRGMYVPLISRAGSYTKRPIYDGHGRMESFVNLYNARKAAKQYIKKHGGEFGHHEMEAHIGYYTCEGTPDPVDE